MRIPSWTANTMRQLAAIAVYLALCSLLTTVHAAFRGPGKYSGVVIFDRWDTCFLLSGTYITYISEAVKEELRPYAGQAIQIDVTDIVQPMNPGDGRATSYAILGLASDDPSDPIDDQIEIVAEPAFEGLGVPLFDITVKNVSLKPVTVNPSEIGPTLLGVNGGMAFSPSDGKSTAWVTRVNLAPRGPDQTGPVTSTWTLGEKTIYAKFNVEEPCTFNDRFELAAQESMSCRVHFDVPAGEYQFIVGYGGALHQWKSIASNAISFKVNAAGIAKVER